MAINDSVADMLTRIRNATEAGHKTVSFPASKLKEEICKILQQEKFIRKFVVVEDGKQGEIKILLKYLKGEAVISGLKRVSRPGRRVYCKASSIPKVLNGMGVSIMSTPRGLMTDRDSVKQNMGGELLCQVW